MNKLVKILAIIVVAVVVIFFLDELNLQMTGESWRIADNLQRGLKGISAMETGGITFIVLGIVILMLLGAWRLNKGQLI